MAGEGTIQCKRLSEAAAGFILYRSLRVPSFNQFMFPKQQTTNTSCSRLTGLSPQPKHTGVIFQLFRGLTTFKQVSNSPSVRLFKLCCSQRIPQGPQRTRALSERLPNSLQKAPTASPCAKEKSPPETSPTHPKDRRSKANDCH